VENHPEDQKGLKNVLNNKVRPHEMREFVKCSSTKNGCDVDSKVLQQEDH
jgi:hypothetical protein